MRLALLSDLHANLRAFQACVAHARAQGATQFAVLGDIVGYGAEPAQVVDAVRALAAEGAVVLKGNHDELAVSGASGDTMEAAGAAWTHAQLDGAQRAYLDALPLDALAGDTLLVHATADEPAAWHYADNVPRVQRSLEAAAARGARRVFVGHVHAQRLYFEGMRGAPTAFDPTPGVAIPLAPHRRWLATVGSVGQPRDGDARAMYAIFDAAGSRLTFHRVPYDHLATAASIRAAGLPAYFADRLGQGR